MQPALAASTDLGTETPICTVSGWQVMPRIDGDLIVWDDYRNGNWDVYLYDLSTGTERRVTTNSANQTSPAVSADRIVWEDDRNGNLDIYMYDLSAGKEVRITDETASQWHPVIDGDRIVWYDVRGADLDLYLYDIASGTETRISCSPVTEWWPAISGDLVAWEDNRNGNGDIYLYDAATQTQRRITTNTARQAYPALSGDILLWEDERGGDSNADIYQYDLETGTETRLTTNPASQVSPTIDGDLAAWEDRRSGNWDICLYNRVTGAEEMITDETANQWFPSISKNRVVWEDRRSGEGDIYLFTVGGGSGPTASFSGSPRSGEAPLTVQFTDASSGDPTSWSWDFGDGGTSTVQNPQYTYTRAGDYTVTLTVADADGSDTGTRTAYIRVTEPSLPTASFDANVTGGAAPLAVQFTDTSTGDPTAWSWDFGDGSVSNETNPVHTFAAIGTYTVSLTVENELGNRTEEKPGYITVASLPDAAFDANITRGAAPLAVGFTDRSTGVPVSWSWDFGDGTTSGEQNPVHVYAEAGTYTVTLTATNPAGSDTVEAADSIVVFEPPAASFTANATAGFVPFAVRFNDTSTGNPVSWLWDFGDNAISTEANPVHVYTDAGTYPVSLTVANDIGGDTLTRSDYITVTVPPRAAFDANVTLGTSPLVVQFTDESTGNPKTWRWDFGDGRSSVKQHPVHTYTAVGNYSVSLTVTGDDGTVTEEMVDYICVVAQPSANFSASATAGMMPLSVTFTDTSTGIPTGWLWTFGDGATSTQQNPVHTYAVAGTYTVSLNVTNPAGSDSLTKADLVSVAPAPTTSVPSSGGGGGGGGGGGSYRSFVSDTTPAVTPTPTPVPTTDPVTDLGVNASGLMTRSVQVSSADNVTTLQLDEGIRATDAAGAPLPEVTVSRIAPADLPALPDGAAFLVADYAYRFGPEGAVFDPAVPLTFAIPEDVWKEYSGSDGRFTVRWYNPENETWEDLPTDVDEETWTISARISHFSTYALFRESKSLLSPDTGLAVSIEHIPAGHSQGLPFMQIATGLFALLVIIGGAYLYVERNRP